MAPAAPRGTALVIDPDAGTRPRFTALVESAGYRAVGAASGAEGLEKFHGAPPALVLFDLDLPDIPGRQLLRLLRDNGGGTPVIVLARAPDVPTAVEMTRAGATEFLDKATSPERLRQVLEAAVPGTAAPAAAVRGADVWERDRTAFFGFYDQVFHHSEKMQAVERLVVQVADTPATVLIQGETGVGKELVAKALHYLSKRSARPWLKVNCASLPPDLLESELFGHEKGAFTGAAVRKPGRFELAHGGTFLLDEIGEMPLGLQSKILHVLQDNEFFRVGGRELISVDVRIIAATNKNIQSMVAMGSFREDLYYRLNVVNIFVPPLRERRAEIPPLIAYCQEKFMQQFNRQRPPLTADAMELLMAYSWPGNVRELENLVKRYVVLGDEGHLRDELQVRLRVGVPQPVLTMPAVAGPAPAPVAEGVAAAAAIRFGLREIAQRAAREAEAAAIKEVLERVRWNRAEAARLLKVSYKTLLAKLEQGGFGSKPRATRPVE